MSQPRLTISLVTYNGRRWLPGCLESIRRQELSDYELLILDNGSQDGSIELLRNLASSDARVQLTESRDNLGFAVAHNRLIANARGEYVAIVNQDLELDPEFLREAVAAFAGRPRVGAVQGRIGRLSWTDREVHRTGELDTTGLEMHRDRRVVSRRQGEQLSARDSIPGPVWGVDGPAPVMRRSALMDARVPRTDGGFEFFDEDFFMYKEDVDLAWRLRLLGWTAWYQPSAIAWHARTAGGGPDRGWSDVVRSNRAIPAWIKAISWRNQRAMQIKNDAFLDALRDLPWIARREIGSLVVMLATDRARLAMAGELRRSLGVWRKKRALVGRSVALRATRSS
jgi:GT2 family glycosyltransferase